MRGLEKNIITDLSERQLHGLYELGTKRQYKKEDVEVIVDRIVENAGNGAPEAAHIAELRRLAGSSESYQDFITAVDDIRSHLE